MVSKEKLEISTFLCVIVLLKDQIRTYELETNKIGAYVYCIDGYKWIYTADILGGTLTSTLNQMMEDGSEQGESDYDEQSDDEDEKWRPESLSNAAQLEWRSLTASLNTQLENTNTPIAYDPMI